jgi:ABC-2 type transport system permease protein
MPDSTATPRPIRRFSIATNVTIQLLVAMLLLGIVNYLSYRHYVRWDLTRERRFTLSEQAQAYLQSLRGKIQVVAAFPRGSDEEAEVRALLEEYRRWARKTLEVDYLDLAREPSRGLEIGKKYGMALKENGLIVAKEIQSKPRPTADGATPPSVPPAAAPSAPTLRKRFIAAKDIFSYDEEGPERRMTEFRGDEALLSAIIGVYQKAAPVVYLITSNMDDLPRAAQPNGAQVDARNVLYDMAAKQDLDVRMLNLTGVSAIPDDAAAVVSLRAFDFPQREVELLSDFWSKRKAAGLLFLLDPEADLTRLDGFLSANGVRPRNDRVLKVVSTAQGTRKELAVPAAFNPAAAVTAPLGSAAITFPEQTKSLRLEEDASRLRPVGLEVQWLAVATPDYWGEINYYESAPRRDDADVGVPEPVVLAASIERGAQSDPRLRVPSSRMIVVGNAALIDPARDTAGVSPSAYDFVSASLNWILDRDELIGVASRQMAGYHLNLSPAHTAKVLALCLGLLPGVVVAFALFMWSVRRS